MQRKRLIYLVMMLTLLASALPAAVLAEETHATAPIDRFLDRLLATGS